MKTTLVSLFLASMLSVPAFAGLKIIASPNKPGGYIPGETGTITLSVMLPVGDSPVQVSQVAGIGVTSPVFSFGGAVNAPTLLNPSGQGVNPFEPALVGGGFAIPFVPPPQIPVTVLPGATVDIATFNFLYNTAGTFNFEVNGLQAQHLANVHAQVMGAIPGGVVTAIPEPSSFLFLGLIGTGVVGAQLYRRRKLAAQDGAAPETAENSA